MSVVVAIKQDGVVYMGCDSQVTKGSTRVSLKNPNNYKIWNVRGVDHCIMGHVGLVREANVVRLIDGLIGGYDQYLGIDYPFIVKRVVPNVVSELKRAGYLKDDQFFERMESSYLFAYEDQAIGSLLSTEGQSPRSRIIKAIKASVASDIYVNYPIIITDTRTGEFEVITETEAKKALKGETK